MTPYLDKEAFEKAVLLERFLGERCERQGLRLRALVVPPTHPGLELAFRQGT